MTPLRAAIIGLGVGEQHIAGYRAHPDCEVVALCDIAEDRLRAAGERYPGLRLTTDPDEVLQDPAVDVVSVASYDDAHFGQVRSALDHGKHVFAEKPLCLYEKEARELRSLHAARPELVLSSNLPLRLSPRFVELRSLIMSGAFGELFYLEGDYDYGRRHKLTDGWRGRIPYYSVVLGGAVHVIDLLLWLTGEEVVEVTAESNKVATRDTTFAHDDFVVATLRFASGVLAKVTANLGCISEHFHGVKVYGTKATFINGLPDGILYTQAPDNGVTTTRVNSPYPGVLKGDLITSFVDAILGKGPPIVSPDDVFATLAVCFAVERAVASGDSVGPESFR